MAKKVKKTKRFYFTKTNWLLLVLGLVLIIIGFALVNSQVNLGVILLVLGYVVFVPLSILMKPKIQNN